MSLTTTKTLPCLTETHVNAHGCSCSTDILAPLVASYKGVMQTGFKTEIASGIDQLVFILLSQLIALLQETPELIHHALKKLHKRKSKTRRHSCCDLAKAKADIVSCEHGMFQNIMCIDSIPDNAAFLYTLAKCLRSMAFIDISVMCGEKCLQGRTAYNWISTPEKDYPIESCTPLCNFLIRYMPVCGNFLREIYDFAPLVQTPLRSFFALEGDAGSATPQERLVILILQTFAAAVLNALNKDICYRFPLKCITVLFSQLICNALQLISKAVDVRAPAGIDALTHTGLIDVFCSLETVLCALAIENARGLEACEDTKCSKELKKVKAQPITKAKAKPKAAWSHKTCGCVGATTCSKCCDTHVSSSSIWKEDVCDETWPGAYLDPCDTTTVHYDVKCHSEEEPLNPVCLNIKAILEEYLTDVLEALSVDFCSPPALPV